MEGSVSEDCKDDFVNKSGIGRSQLTEVEEQIFGGYCKGDCFHN